MTPIREVVCISTSDWERPWGSRQQIMRRLAARGARVLFVESQWSVLHPLRYPWMWRRYAAWQRGPVERHPGLWTVTPAPSVPGHYYSARLCCWSQRRLADQIRRWMRALGIERPVLWAYAPSAAHLVGRLGEAFTVYHCIEAFGDERNSRARRRVIDTCERALARSAAAVFAMSCPLATRLREENAETYVTPSAVDETLFFDDTDLVEPSDLRPIARPRLAVVANLNRRIDVDLLEQVVTGRPDWSLVLIGPIWRDGDAVSRLRAHPNVLCLGRKAPADIPAYLRHVDVGLIPFARTAFTRAISPLKLYEYAAAGLPVVSTLPYSGDRPPHAETAVDTAGFIRAVETLLAANATATSDAQRAWVRRHTWTARVDEMLVVLKRVAAEHG